MLRIIGAAAVSVAAVVGTNWAQEPKPDTKSSSGEDNLKASAGHTAIVRPGNSEYKQGIQAQQKLDYAKAIAHFTVAIKLDGQNADAFLQRGACQAIQHRDRDALRDFNRAIELKPDFADAYSKRGTILLDANRTDEGQRDLEKAVELNPRQADAQYLLGMLLLAMRNDPPSALRHLDKAAALSPKNGEVFKGRALVHRRLGNVAKAQEDESRAKKLGAVP
jgi:tetratricopeptide (TPR) repeat protein